MKRIKHVLPLAIAFLLLTGYFLASEAIGAYYSGKTISYQIVPDLSGVPTPTPEPTPTPTQTPITGSGLVFDSVVSLYDVNWNGAYDGAVTSTSLSVDNKNHILDFDITFTMPDKYTEQYIKSNKNWFSGFTLRVSGTNYYDGKISLAGLGSSGSGSGVAQLQNMKLSIGQSSDDIRVYFYGGDWMVPGYNAQGNTVTVDLQKSWHDIGIDTEDPPYYRTERYTIKGTVALVLPPRTMPANGQDSAPAGGSMEMPVPKQTSQPTYTPVPIQTPQPTYTPVPAQTPLPTFTPAPIPTPEPTSEPTSSPISDPTAMLISEPTATPTSTANATEMPVSMP